ncbi:MAG: hypothetical protein M9892_03155 [Bacteroidetes bacterium]|nr:hypothetical protein [Bacteroidota bacterium]
MNKFNIPSPSGGYKLKAQDLNLIYDYLKSGIEGLAYKESCILTGCRANLLMSNPMIGITQGYIAMKGEVYWVAEQSWDMTVVTDPVLVPYEEVQLPSPRVSADGSSKNVHFRRWARVEQSASQPTKYRIKELADYGFEWYTVYNPSELIVISALDIEYDVSGGWRKIGSDLAGMGYGNLRVRKWGQYMELSGSCRKESFDSNNLIITFPNLSAAVPFPRLMPAKEQVVLVPLSEVSPLAGPGGDPYLVEPNHWASVVFKTNGNVEVAHSSYSGSDDVMLHFNHRVHLQ